MAENTSIVLETTNRLDENENPALSDINITVDSVSKNDLENSLPTNTKNIMSGKPDNSVSNEQECLIPTKTITESEYHNEISDNGDKLLLGNDSCLSLSVTNNSHLANGTCNSEDISRFVPGPNFMENSLCSNEENLNLSKSSNHNILSISSEVNDNNENSLECRDLERVKFPSSLDQDLVNFSSSNQSILAEKSILANCSQSDALLDHPVQPESTNSNKMCDFSESVTLINVIANEDIQSSQGLSKGEDNLDGEEFQDAVQFFKDPSSFQFLENIKTSDQPESVLPRDSLYMTFDPLHKKFVQPSSVQNNAPIPSEESVSSDTLDLHVNVEAANEVVDKEVASDVVENSLPIENKVLTDVAQRESFGNILLSFDSPMKSNSARNSSKPNDDCPFSDVPKLYTEEELQQAVKINELSTQEVYLKKQREMEEEFKKGIQEKDEQIEKLGKVCFSLQNVAEELMSVLSQLTQKNESLSSKNLELESAKQKLSDDLKTSSEDLQSVEHTFADFHKRYEQCKGMLKTYKDNEGNLMLQIESLKKKLEEQEQMYNMLQERTEEMVEKANTEVANVKKGGDAQIAVLRAQLKKSELKISSLESDLKQVRIENDKLSGICDDLMAKVSES